MQNWCSILSLTTPKTNIFNCTFIPAVDKQYVLSKKQDLIENGAINHNLFSMKFDKRLEQFGLNGRNIQDHFTVACHMTHRRAWINLLESTRKYILVLESDAVYNFKTNVKKEIENIVHDIDNNWDIINLGRCWDFCNNEIVDYLFDNFKLISSSSSGCTHAYLVSRSGARKMLYYTIPYIISVDYLIALLSRNIRLQMYSVSPRMFDQRKSVFAHDLSNLPECDPDEEKNYDLIRKRYSLADSRLVETIYQKHDDHVLRILEDGVSYNWYNSLRRWSNFVRKAPCDYEKYCEFVSGTERPSDTEREFNKKLDLFKLRGVIIWGFTEDDGHTHKHIHLAMYNQVKQAFSTSQTTRYVCHIPTRITRMCTMSINFFKRSLFIASPKHSYWSFDSTFKNLPVFHKSYYIFHELSPVHFRHIKNKVNWVVRGPDGNVPNMEAEHFVLKKYRYCHKLICFFKRENGYIYVSPWATKYTHRMMKMTDVQPRNNTVNFVGTIWDVNFKTICEFCKKCPHISFHRYGKKHNFKCDTDNWIEHTEYVSDITKDILHAQSEVLITLQGDEHIEGNNSYISDRVLDALTKRQSLITNNPAIEHFFKFPATFECHGQIPSMEINDMLLQEHTYISRLNDMLSIFNRNEFDVPNLLV